MADAMERDAEWQRLEARYREMADEQLLELAEGIDNLTETARVVLGRELRARKLSTTTAEIEIEASAAVQAEADPDGMVALTTFYDATAAGRACAFLEAEEVDFALQDVSEPESGLRSLEGGPPVALRLLVAETDRSRSMTILRRAMGLFPLQEVEVADEVVDDGSMACVGTFAEREDADEVTKILENASIWHRLVVNPEGSAKTEDVYSVEVREVDLFEAGDAIESALE